jgi:hydroxypyruvate reductase
VSVSSPDLHQTLPRDRKARKALALDLLQAALAAVDPAAAIRRFVAREGDLLRVGDRLYDLRQYERIFVVGGGKAGAPMAQAIEEILGDRITAGLVNVKYGYTAPTRLIELNQAGHPIPDEKGVAGTQRMVELLKQAGERDLVICLISGGGSALMVLPVPGVSLADKRRLTDALLRSGATINEINAVRKHLSQVKGGNLARLAYPAEIITLILSDVLGNPLDVIASGPTVPDTSTFADAWKVLEKYDLVEVIPPAIADYLRAGLAGQVPETPKPGDPIFQKTYNLIIGSNEIAVKAAQERARGYGLNTLLLSTFVEGEAREVAIVLAAIAREVVHSNNPIARPACILASGETTVTVRGRGLGGRSQELALAAALKIQGLEDVLILSAATDGTDGPTDAAGAIVDGSTVARALARGLDPQRFLADNDSYHFFAQLGDLVITGPTNTNVNDLMIILVF